MVQNQKKNSWVTRAIQSLTIVTLALSVEGVPVVARDEVNVPTKGALQLGFSASRVASQKGDNLHKREGDLIVPLENYRTYYNVQVGVGSPAQVSNVLIDTGSSDLWVIDASNPICKEIDCSEPGVFDPSKSSTYKVRSKDFSIRYADGTFAKGAWATETISLGNQKVTDLTFGNVDNTTSDFGVFGLGYPSNEASNYIKNSFTYDNLPILLAEQGVTNTPAYSFWLNDYNSDKGNVLFGAVDNAKFHGKLSILDTIKDSSNDTTPREFRVGLESIKVKKNIFKSHTVASSIEALLDTGTTLTYLPKDIASEIFDSISAKKASNGLYTAPCLSLGSVTFNFNGASIEVPTKDLMLPTKSLSSNPLQYPVGTCFVGIIPSGRSYAILGDTFLRSAYVVYDMKNHQIGIAKVRNTPFSDIKLITDKIPA